MKIFLYICLGHEMFAMIYVRKIEIAGLVWSLLAHWAGPNLYSLMLVLLNGKRAKNTFIHKYSYLSNIKFEVQNLFGWDQKRI